MDKGGTLKKTKNLASLRDFWRFQLNVEIRIITLIKSIGDIKNLVKRTEGEKYSIRK